MFDIFQPIMTTPWLICQFLLTSRDNGESAGNRYVSVCPSAKTVTRSNVIYGPKQTDPNTICRVKGSNSVFTAGVAY